MRRETAGVSVSAGLLLYRRTGGGLEVLVAHMGGPLWARRDAGAWTVPKGEPEPGEDLHDAAVREFTEELGLAPPPGVDLLLGEVRQKGGKVVHAWAREGDLDVDLVVPGTFEMEWPPRSGRRQTFPEVDRAAWLPLDRARALVVAAQAEILDRLAAALGDRALD